jgi:hypothetical protein
VYDLRRQADFQSPSAPPRATGSLLPVLVVVGFVLIVTMGVIGFTGLAGLYILLAVLSVLAFAAMHYVLWGWWLLNKVRREQADADDDEE